MSKVNLERPELHISADALRVTDLRAAAKHLLASEQSEEEKVGHAIQIMQGIEDFLQDMDRWTSAMTGIWKPTSHDAQPALQPAEGPTEHPDHPLKHFMCPRIFRYIDIHLVGLWTFYSACQIVLRETFVQVMRFNANFQIQDQQVNQERVEREQSAINELSGSIIRSFPPLMGFGAGSFPPPSSQGMMVGQFSGLFAMDVIRAVEFTSSKHKNTARKVTEWIAASHKLG